MRVSTLLCALLAATGSALAGPSRNTYSRSSKTVPARHVDLAARRTDVVAARQFHHLARKEPLLDICANINTDTILGNSELLGIPLKDIIGLNLCICISALPLEIGISVQLDALINKHGAPLLNAVIELLINTSLDSRQCSYPEFSTASCSLNPCEYTCDAPYVSKGDECVCESPNTLCNGKCVGSSVVCTSAVPRAIARRSALVAESQSSCRDDEQVCGVYGAGSDAFECVNTSINLESCGGCVVPNPFVTINASTPVGQDCSAIDGADTVTCTSGRCAVESCLPEWEVTADSSGCEQRTHTSALSSLRLLSVLSDVFLS